MTSGEREGGIDETVGLLSCPETQSNEYLTTSRAFLKVKAEMHWRERDRETFIPQKIHFNVASAPLHPCCVVPPGSSGSRTRRRRRTPLELG